MVFDLDLKCDLTEVKVQVSDTLCCFKGDILGDDRWDFKPRSILATPAIDLAQNSNIFALHRRWFCNSFVLRECKLHTDNQ